MVYDLIDNYEMTVHISNDLHIFQMIYLLIYGLIDMMQFIYLIICIRFVKGVLIFIFLISTNFYGKIIEIFYYAWYLI